MGWMKPKKAARLKCPFCRAELDRPPKNHRLQGGEYYKSSCACKAAYGYDPSGCHLGAALMETLVHAVDDDWDRALDMDEGTDYEIRYVDGYLGAAHRVAPGMERPRPGRGALVFVRLIGDQ